MNIVIFGLSITSSWGNGHATTYRALVSALAARGHQVLFVEREAEWYSENRDLPSPPYCRVELYHCIADLDMVGSYVPEGIEVGDFALRHARGLTAFYDIDTPVTLARLAGDAVDYLSRQQISKNDLYLSFTRRATLDRMF